MIEKPSKVLNVNPHEWFRPLDDYEQLPYTQNEPNYARKSIQISIAGFGSSFLDVIWHQDKSRISGNFSCLFFDGYHDRLMEADKLAAFKELAEAGMKIVSIERHLPPLRYLPKILQPFAIRLPQGTTLFQTTASAWEHQTLESPVYYQFLSLENNFALAQLEFSFGASIA